MSEAPKQRSLADGTAQGDSRYGSVTVSSRAATRPEDSYRLYGPGRRYGAGLSGGACSGTYRDAASGSHAMLMPSLNVCTRDDDASCESHMAQSACTSKLCFEQSHMGSGRSGRETDFVQGGP